jgi:hypothetical protein
MNDTELLTYGQRELPAFRADMRELGTIAGVNCNVAAAHLRVILRNADERHNAAGLTRTQAERACVLAAAVERKAAQQ